MSFKLPTTLWAPYGQVRVKRAPKAIRNPQGEYLAGQYIYDDRLIRISPDLDDDRVIEVTLNHEWLHAVMGDAGCDSVLTRKQQEWVAEVVGQAITRRFGATTKR